MPLRPSPTLTLYPIDANCCHARKSTGSRPAPGEFPSRLNGRRGVGQRRITALGAAAPSIVNQEAATLARRFHAWKME